MKTLVILNCIDDAKHFLNNYTYDDLKHHLVSTHPSVNNYFESNKIKCDNLSNYLNYYEIKKREQLWGNQYYYYLNKFDEKFSEKISKIIGLSVNINYFFPLYRYFGLRDYNTINNYYQALKNILKINNFETIIVYKSINFTFIGNSNDLISQILVKIIDIEEKINIIENKDMNNYFLKDKIDNNYFIYKIKNIKSDKLNNYFSLIKNIVRVLRKNNNKIIKKFMSFKNRKILLFETLYDLNFLKNDKYVHICIRDKMEELRINLNENEKHQTLIKLNKIKNYNNSILEDEIDKISYKYIIEDIEINLIKYLEILKGFNKLFNKNKIVLGVWGSPPVCNIKSLIFEYLLKNNITVLGMQHGGGYFETNYDYVHFESDYNWCNYYLSYGFSEDDISQISPARVSNQKCKIIPVGHIYSSIKKKTNKSIIDLLIPMSVINNYIANSFLSQRYKLYLFYKEIFNYLDNFKNKNIVIKPHFNCNDKNFPFIDSISKYKNIKIINGTSFLECLQYYDVKAVLVDLHATVLLQTICMTDSQIFLYKPKESFEHPEYLLNDLEKRVHIFDNAESFKKIINNYFENKLKLKTDDTYKNKYYTRPDSKKRIRKIIDSLIS